MNGLSNSDIIKNEVQGAQQNLYKPMTLNATVYLHPKVLYLCYPASFELLDLFELFCACGSRENFRHSKQAVSQRLTGWLLELRNVWVTAFFFTPISPATASNEITSKYDAELYSCWSLVTLRDPELLTPFQSLFLHLSLRPLSFLRVYYCPSSLSPLPAFPE